MRLSCKGLNCTNTTLKGRKSNPTKILTKILKGGTTLISFTCSIKSYYSFTCSIKSYYLETYLGPCKTSMNGHFAKYIAQKVSVFRVFLVHIFLHSDLIRRFPLQISVLKKTPNMDTFYAVTITAFEPLTIFTKIFIIDVQLYPKSIWRRKEWYRVLLKHFFYTHPNI